MTVLSENQFHMVWSHAIGKPGYDKSLFTNLLKELVEKKIVIPTTEIKTLCICKGFYTPPHCPVHGSDGIEKRST